MPSEKRKYDNEEILRKVSSVKNWYHQIELAPGIITPGISDTSPKWLELPDDCTGLRVLDIGTRDGLFAFECEKRGAEVVAVDYTPKEATGFACAAEVLNSKVEFVHDNIYNLTPERFGTFDIVLFLGLLYHLRDPLCAIDIARKLCHGHLYLETHVIDNSVNLPDGSFAALEQFNPALLNIPLMQFYAKDTAYNDDTNYWGPNLRCMELMLEECNFKVLDKQISGTRSFFKCIINNDATLEFQRKIARGEVHPTESTSGYDKQELRMSRQELKIAGLEQLIADQRLDFVNQQQLINNQEQKTNDQVQKINDQSKIITDLEKRIADQEHKIHEQDRKIQKLPYFKLKKAYKKMFKKSDGRDGRQGKVEQAKREQRPSIKDVSPVAASPLTGPIPMPPVELRTIVGPTDEAVFDNPDGSLIWGELAFGPLKPGEAYSSIFDFGCGCGRNARQLMLQHKKPEKYMGIDIASELIEWCQNNLTPRDANFRFMHHDVFAATYAPQNSNNRHLPFPAGDGEYALLNAHSVFTHLYYDQSEYYLNEARRIITDKGLIRSTWFFFNKMMFPVLAPSQHCLYVNELDPTQAVYYDWEQFLALVHSLGLSVVSATWTQVPGHQNVIMLGKSETFNDISAGLTPPKTVLGY